MVRYGVSFVSTNSDLFFPNHCNTLHHTTFPCTALYRHPIVVELYLRYISVQPFCGVLVYHSYSRLFLEGCMILYKHPYDTISRVLEKRIVKYIRVTGLNLFSNETAPVCGFAQGMGGRSSKTSITFNFDFISQLLQSMLITHNQSCIRHLYNKPKTMPYHLLVCIIMSVRQAKIAKFNSYQLTYSQETYL